MILNVSRVRASGLREREPKQDHYRFQRTETTMDDNDRAALAAHNQRVRALADAMPAGPLADAVCAIGYRADKHTGEVSGYSVPTMARLSQGQPWKISGRELDRAIRTLAEAGVIKITHPPAKDGKRQANVYVIDYEWRDTERVSEVWDMGRRGRRGSGNGQRARSPMVPAAPRVIFLSQMAQPRPMMRRQGWRQS